MLLTESKISDTLLCFISKTTFPVLILLANKINMDSIEKHHLPHVMTCNFTMGFLKRFFFLQILHLACFILQKNSAILTWQKPDLPWLQLTYKTETLSLQRLFLHYLGFICSLCIILQYSGKTKVRHLALKAACYQDVASSQIPVHIVVFWKVGHAGGYSLQHVHKLHRAKFFLILLHGRNERRPWSSHRIIEP